MERYLAEKGFYPEAINYAKKEGIVEGKAEGRVEGKAEGIAEERLKTITLLRESGMRDEEISFRLKIDIEELKSL